MIDYPKAQIYVGTYINNVEEFIHTQRINDQVMEFTVPFLDRHNDHIQFYMIEQDGTGKLTDDSQTLAEVPKEYMDTVRKYVESTLRRFAVKLEGESIVADYQPGQVAARLHTYIESLFAVNCVIDTVLSMLREVHEVM